MCSYLKTSICLLHLFQEGRHTHTHTTSSFHLAMNDTLCFYYLSHLDEVMVFTLVHKVDCISDKKECLHWHLTGNEGLGFFFFLVSYNQEYIIHYVWFLNNINYSWLLNIGYLFLWSLVCLLWYLLKVALDNLFLFFLLSVLSLPKDSLILFTSCYFCNFILILILPLWRWLPLLSFHFPARFRLLCQWISFSNISHW